MNTQIAPIRKSEKKTNLSKKSQIWKKEILHICRNSSICAYFWSLKNMYIDQCSAQSFEQ